PAKRAQKDTEARWTRKHAKSHYGYKTCPRPDREADVLRPDPEGRQCATKRHSPISEWP
ncbi:MAG: IS5/IS1182 family transposase, partial [Gammaproteobacteria bacterium]